MFLHVFLINILFCIGCSCSKILAIVPTPSHSHQVALYPIWKELSLRGHQITLLTTHPVYNASLTNLTIVDLSFAKDIWNTGLPSVIEEQQHNFLSYCRKLKKLCRDVASAELKHPKVQQLIKGKVNFDLVFTEVWYPATFALAENFRCPLILVSTLDPYNELYWTIGNPSHPVLNPDFSLGYAYPLNLYERFASMCYDIYVRYYVPMLTDVDEDNDITTYFGESFPKLRDVYNRIAMLFVNTNPLFSFRMQIPSIVQIGEGNHLTSQNLLSKELQDILDNSKNGAIYFSLGTNFKTTQIDTNTLTIIMETFRELAPVQILMKYDHENLKEIPNNVYTAKWFPQQSVLSHPNIKLFITQGGAQSVEEAILNYVPIIGMPIFADQKTNLRSIMQQGFGLLLDIHTLKKTIFKDAIIEVLENKKYRNHMKEIVELSQDQPMTGLQRAMWWTEYVLRHKGAKHLKSPYRNLPLYQYLFLDIYAIVFIVLLSFLIVLFCLLKLLYKLIKHLTGVNGKPKVE